MTDHGPDRQAGERTASVEARTWEAVDGDGPLGSAPGWTRVLDAESDDALVFTAVDSVPLIAPRLTLKRYSWSHVHAGHWPDPTRFDQRYLDVAIEPYRRPGAEGWTVLRTASIRGRSVIDRSWVFREPEGVCLIRMRCPAELFLDLDLLTDAIVAGVPALTTRDATHVIDHGPGGRHPLPGLVEVSRPSLGSLLTAAGADGPVSPAVLDSERDPLASAGLLDRQWALTAKGRWWARTHVMASSRWVLRVERGDAEASTLDLAVAGSGVAVHLAAGSSRWVGTIHRSRLPEYAARWVGVAPAPHVDLAVPVSKDLLRARLADAATPSPDAGTTPEFQALWQDHWTRWLLAKSTGTPEPGPPVRQFLGTTHHGHFRLRNATDAGAAAGSAEAPGGAEESLLLESVPSTEVFGMFCREMLGPGHRPPADPTA